MEFRDDIHGQQDLDDKGIAGTYVGESYRDGDTYYGADGVVYDDSREGQGKAVADGKVSNIEEVVITKESSLAKQAMNYVTDDIISKPLEGIQMLGYLFYGAFYALPKKSIEEGKLTNGIDMDISVWGFKNGHVHENVYKNDEPMSESEQFEAFTKPVVEAVTAPLSPGIKVVENKFLNKGINAAIKSGIKSGIYQTVPKDR